MASKLNGLTAFFPAYNEEAHIATTVETAKKILPKVATNWEIIIVNDGSKDKTGTIIDKIAKNDKRIRAIHHEVNRGYGAALKTGMYNAKYKWIVFTDGDGQFDFSEIYQFIKTQKETGVDMVIGYYKKRQVPLYRKLNTFGWQTVVYFLFGLKVRDIDCAFKLFKKEVVDTIDPLESERGAFISSEFLIKAKKAGFSMKEIGITHYPRKAGSGTGANIDVIIKSFMDLFRLWAKLR